MKTIKESILSSTKTGMNKILSEVEEYIKNTKFFKRVSNPLSKVKVIPIDGKYQIKITNFKSSSNIFIFDKEDNKGKYMDYPIHSIIVNGIYCDIIYTEIEFKSSNDFVSKVSERVIFQGCKIDEIDSVPENCRYYNFMGIQKIGSRKDTSIGSINNISMSSIITDNLLGGFDCLLSDIKNIKIKDMFFITDKMLGWYSLEKDNKTFTKTASDELTNFFKNNKIEPKNVYFCPLNKNAKYYLGKIEFNKNTGLWEFIGTISKKY
jgi:hypothetical protein